jgi:hypothetical protein|tara:strand:+ start:498 stop:1055 length:558 start_codon:yes stop_codon:yes gene_type:complete
VLEGLAFQTTVGSLSTPITGGGNGTVLDKDQSELVLSVPDGTTMIPTRIRVDCQVAVDQDADEQEILIAVDRTQISNASGSTGTAETAINMRTDLTSSSALTVTSANTSNHTDPTLSVELAHAVKITNVVTSGITLGELMLTYEPVLSPVIVGPAHLLVYWGGTQAVTGFASAEWIEFDSTRITS